MKGKSTSAGLDVYKFVVFCVVCLLSLVFIGGLLSSGIIAPMFESNSAAALRNQAAIERQAVELQREKELEPVYLTSKAALVLVGTLAMVVVMVGLSVAIAAGAVRRALEVKPGSNGLYPVLYLPGLKGSTVYDPNRQLSYAATIDAGGVRAHLDAATLPAQAALALSVAGVQTAAARSLGNGGGRVVETSRPVQDIPANEQIIEGRAVELPNRIDLVDVLPSQVTQDNITLGVTVENNQVVPVTAKLENLVHIAIGGSSGWGKSKLLQSLALQLAMTKAVDLALIDLEGVTFSKFAECGALAYPIADTSGMAAALLVELVGELERRKMEYKRAGQGIESLADYNRLGGDMRPLVCLIDESVSLLTDKSIQATVKELALRARKYGIDLVLGGQDWKAESLDTTISNQLSTRLQLKALSPTQSRVLIGARGAESIATPGRAMAVLPGRPGVLHIQTPFVDGATIEKILTGAAIPARPAKVIDAGSASLGGDQARAARILELSRQGLSMRAIEKETFGYSGGAAHDVVRAVINDATTTTDR